MIPNFTSPRTNLCTCNKKWLSSRQVHAHQSLMDALLRTASADGSTARAVRQELVKEEVTAANVRSATSLTLMRLRARTLRATYEKLWRCFANNERVPFVYSSHEGEGSDGERMENLRKYISAHVRRVEDLRTLVERNSSTKSRWKKANKGGGKRARMFAEREAAVIAELQYRETNGTIGEEEMDARATSPVDDSAKTVTPVLYPAAYAADIARIEREMEAEEEGVKKPSRGEKLTSARTSAYERGDMKAVKSIEATIKKRQDTRRAARHRKKARKEVVRAQLRDYAYQNRAPDPPSDHERS